MQERDVRAPGVEAVSKAARRHARADDPDDEVVGAFAVTGAQNPPSPFIQAGFFSRLSYHWMNVLFKIGAIRQIVAADLFALDDSDKSAVLTDALERSWDAGVIRHASGEVTLADGHSLHRAFYLTFRRHYGVSGVWAMLETVFKLAQPVALIYLIRFVGDGPDAPLWQGYLAAAALVLATIGHGLVHHVYFFRVMRIGMWMRVASINLLFRKSLRLSHSALLEATTGQIINMASNDVFRFDKAMPFLWFALIGPIEAAIGFYLIWREVEYAAVAGYGFLLLLLPVQFVFARVFGNLRRQTSVITDERVKVMEQVVSGIKILKCYAWESPFVRMVEDVRQREISRVRQSSMLRGANMGLFFSSPAIISFITFTTYFFTDHVLTAEKVFSTLAVLNVVRMTMTLFFPNAIEGGSELYVSIGRIEQFLLQSELTLPALEAPPPPSSSSSASSVPPAGPGGRAVGQQRSLVPVDNDSGAAESSTAVVLPSDGGGGGGQAFISAHNITCSWGLEPDSEDDDEEIGAEERVEVTQSAAAPHSLSPSKKKRWNLGARKSDASAAAAAEHGDGGSGGNCSDADAGGDADAVPPPIKKRGSSMFRLRSLRNSSPSRGSSGSDGGGGGGASDAAAAAAAAVVVARHERSQKERDARSEARRKAELRARARRDPARLRERLMMQRQATVAQVALTLQQVSVEARSGELVAIVGPVGCGKSSLLMALLGELSVLKPSQFPSVAAAAMSFAAAERAATAAAAAAAETAAPATAAATEAVAEAVAEPSAASLVCRRGSVAYVSQEAWIVSGTVRSNILFGLPFDADWYARVIDACALVSDLDILPDGDRTEIGERGVNLSGGQKARVSLARAVYARADVYLLDDPLSAVDPKVGRHLFDRCIRGLLGDKAVVLVTHQLQYLADTTRILILQGGRSLGSGTFAELLRSGLDFAELLMEEDEGGAKGEGGSRAAGEQSSAPIGGDVGGDGVDIPADAFPAKDVGAAAAAAAAAGDYCSRDDNDDRDDCADGAGEGGEGATQKKPQRLVEAEVGKSGTIGLKLYKEYFAAGAGLATGVFVLFVMALGQCAIIASDWWLSYWTDEERQRGRESNVEVYAAIVAGTFVVSMSRAFLWFHTAVNASRTLHDRMFARTVRAPMAFFDANPIGRILNRFSQDTGITDDLLPLTFYDTLQSTFMVVGAVGVVCVVNYYVVIAVVPLAVAFFLLRRYFLQTSREVKRLEGAARSPIYSLFSSSLTGLTTIRAFEAQPRFTEAFEAALDGHSRAFLMWLYTARWLGFRLDAIAIIFIACTAFGAVLARSILEPGTVGLSMAYVLQLNSLMQWSCRQSAETEQQMTSVERILEFTELPQEAPLRTAVRPAPTWPERGAVRFSHVHMAYRPGLPDVLRDVSVRIRPSEKVGIVGRTGAGKSTLTTVLFRLVEPRRGAIEIDGMDISTLGLHDLRSALSIVPQEPVLYSGTVRTNLDPLSQHDDPTLWAALEEVELRREIEAAPAQLLAPMAEAGSNFSIGQRQLICLARAILRDSKVLVMDEASANIDLATDTQLQETIRRKFRTSTVLTVAHRLHTIIDYDRVMVMDKGRLVECGPPHALLVNPRSLFSTMVAGTGPIVSSQLRELARRHFVDTFGTADVDAVPWRDDGEALDAEEGLASHGEGHLGDGGDGEVTVHISCV